MIGDGKTTLPSLDSLKELLAYFSKQLENEPDGQLSPTFVKDALETIWGVNLALAPGIRREQDRHFQEDLADDVSVWLVADRLAEETDTTGAWIRTVAAAVYGRGVQYVYFLPFSKLEEECRLLGESIRAEAAQQGLDTSKSGDRLQVYQLSDMAFTSRMRLVLPLPPRQPYGHMGVTDDKGQILRVLMPRDLVDRTVERLNALMRNLKNKLDGNPKVGLLRKVFPI